MKNRRPAAHPQLTQTRLSLQATVGSFNTAASFITFSEYIRILLTPAPGSAPLFGRVVQSVFIAHFFRGTLLKKFTLATSRFGHHRFGFTGFMVVFGGLRLMTCRTANNFFSCFVNIKVINSQLLLFVILGLT